ncbi:MAG TPA: hypothetical protein VFT15_15380, partial [Chitinophagaceae bacterium]|nr:hypothetical protein [Chitinophagaceae bacterium]
YSSFTGHGLINIFNRLALYLDLLPFWEDGMGQLYGSWFFTSISSCFLHHNLVWTSNQFLRVSNGGGFSIIRSSIVNRRRD